MIELNKVMLMARLTRDPETKFLPSGSAVCEMRVAADRRWKSDGEDKKETLFINVTAWGKTAEFCQQWFKKGGAIFVEGRIGQQTWKDKETGKDREKIFINAERVSFGESKAEAEGRQGGGGGDRGDDPPPRRAAAPKSDPPPTAGDSTKDDLPF